MRRLRHHPASSERDLVRPARDHRSSRVAVAELFFNNTARLIPEAAVKRFRPWCALVHADFRPAKAVLASALPRRPLKTVRGVGISVVGCRSRARNAQRFASEILSAGWPARATLDRSTKNCKGSKVSSDSAPLPWENRVVKGSSLLARIHKFSMDRDV
jgi:hypothetical protein